MNSSIYEKQKLYLQKSLEDCKKVCKTVPDYCGDCAFCGQILCPNDLELYFDKMIEIAEAKQTEAMQKGE